jgi:hypothetical protein
VAGGGLDGELPSCPQIAVKCIKVQGELLPSYPRHIDAVSLVLHLNDILDLMGPSLPDMAAFFVRLMRMSMLTCVEFSGNYGFSNLYPEGMVIRDAIVSCEDDFRAPRCERPDSAVDGLEHEVVAENGICASACVCSPHSRYDELIELVGERV